MKATAIANTNIALVKYWGKRNEKLILPNNSSISVTLDGLFTKTTVEFNESFSKDELWLGGKKMQGEEAKKAFEHLTLIRKSFRKKSFARVFSENNFPTSAGLASSASGFAALTASATKALGLELKPKELSVIARHGSGSASRSIFGGFVEWRKGDQLSGGDSHAVQLFDEKYWPEFTMIVCVVSEKEKKIKSRTGMAQTVKTAPFYRAWLDTVNEDLKKIKRALKEKNFRLLGETAEMNALKMHATMLTTKPSIVYMEQKSIELMNAVQEMRENGIQAYFTMDAGPQVKIMCLGKDAEKIRQKVEELGVEKIFATRPGSGIRYSDEHLF